MSWARDVSGAGCPLVLDVPGCWMSWVLDVSGAGCPLVLDVSGCWMSRVLDVWVLDVQMLDVQVLDVCESPERTFYGQNGPFLPLFDRFLKLSGSIWAITVLKEQSIPLRCSGHPTSLYFEKKIPTQNWPVEI